MRLVTPEEMGVIDRTARERFGVPGIVLMENAARGLVDIIEDYFPLEGLRVLVVCGSGNNGGDGLAAARHLVIRGAEVKTFLLGDSSRLKGDALTNARIIGIDSRRGLDRLIQDFKPDVIIDAIFGTGFRGRPEGKYRKAISLINESDAFIVAVDIPSGVNGKDGTVEDVAVVADLTITMCLPKTGLFLYPGREYCGDLWVTDIGITPEMIGSGKTNLIDDEEVRGIIPHRPPSGHKGTFGKVIVVAGSRGFSGAACLTASAALRMGAGLVLLGVPDGLIDVVEAKLTEVVKFSLPDTGRVTFSRKAVQPLLSRLKDASVLAIGPGISTDPETKEFLFRIIARSPVPMVIDADGVNNIATEPGILKQRRAPIILTPHPGELSRLIKLSPAEINQNRIEIARGYARRYEVILVIKGAPTVVGSPQGEVWVNPTGNSGLASGGSGDVLTGMIGGLIAQGVDPYEAAKAGVYLHGLAADLALEEENEYSLIAGDLLRFIGPAIDKIFAEPEE